MSSINQLLQNLRLALEDQDDEELEECCICKSEPVNCSLQGCGHEFCEECITEWVFYHRTCPYCRRGVTVDNITHYDKTYIIKVISSKIVQAVVRGWLTRKRMLYIKSAIKIQSIVRSWLTRKFLLHTKSALTIQAVVRGWLTRKSIQRGVLNLYLKGYTILNEYQRDIYKECQSRSSGGGLSLPMGSGKTLIAIVLSLYKLWETKKPILVVCAKSLVASWISEILKFFGDELKYEVIHKSTMGASLDTWTTSDKYIYLTTPDNLAIFYRENNIENVFIGPGRRRNVNFYRSPQAPLLKEESGSGVFYSKEWGIIVIDEAQKYTNIKTQKCRALCSLYSKNRWVLSGTMFDEPKPERILGYYMLINDKGVEHNIPAVKSLIYGRFRYLGRYGRYRYGYGRGYGYGGGYYAQQHQQDENGFTGLRSTLVHRDKNVAFIPPRVNHKIVTHDLTQDEEKLYKTIQTVISHTNDRATYARENNNIEDFKRLNGFLFALIIYLRQILICPLIPITSIAIDMANTVEKAELSTIMMKRISKLQLDDYFNDPASIKSSRITKVIEKIDAHVGERVVLFSCFKTVIDIIKQYITDREVFVMESNMSAISRGKLIEDFRNSSNGVLLLTYSLGAEGLNLQCASTVLLVDFWWNSGKTKQAIARVFRYGQTAKEINIYMFVSNTGIEKIMMQKQKAKEQVIKELQTGRAQTKVPRICTSEIVNIIRRERNERLTSAVYNYGNNYTVI